MFFRAFLLSFSLSHTIVSGRQVRSYSKQFLWGSFGSGFKFHLVRGNIVKLPILEGGSVVSFSYLREGQLLQTYAFLMRH